jgi:hypothetical protein
MKLPNFDLTATTHVHIIYVTNSGSDMIPHGVLLAWFCFSFLTIPVHLHFMGFFVVQSINITYAKLLAESTGEGAETFVLNYFGKTATLAQSAQFYKQIMVGVFERVYEIGATYRAELSFTPRHVTEFTTLDVEMGFVSSF